MTGQKVGYIRVSSNSQNTSRQLDKIELDKTFIEIESGAKKQRPVLDELIEYVRNGDIVFVHSLDRLGRSLTGLIDTIDRINKKGATVTITTQNLTFRPNSDDPFDRYLFHIFGAVAEFQRALIKEAQKEGIKKAKERGAFKGRKRSLNSKQCDQLKDLIEQKHSSIDAYKDLTWKKIAEIMGVSTPTVRRYAGRFK